MSYISDLLYVGENNAVKMQTLMDLTGLSRREVYKHLEKERRNGAVICGTNNGYFIPATTEELQNYIKRVQARVRTESIALHSARALLSEWQLDDEFSPLVRLDEVNKNV